MLAVTNKRADEELVEGLSLTEFPEPIRTRLRREILLVLGEVRPYVECDANHRPHLELVIREALIKRTSDVVLGYILDNEARDIPEYISWYNLASRPVPVEVSRHRESFAPYRDRSSHRLVPRDPWSNLVADLTGRLMAIYRPAG